MSEIVKKVSSRTRVAVEKCIFTWSIENFSLCPMKGKDGLKSSDFTTSKSLQPKWYLQLFPNFNDKPDDSQTEGFLGISLIRRPTVDPSTSYVEWKLSIICSDGTEYNCKKSPGKNIYNNINSSWGWNKYLDRSKLEKDKHLPNDVLTVMCEMEVSVDVTTSNSMDNLIEENSSSYISKSSDSLIGSLQNLFENKMCSDFILKVGEEELKAHKNILCARSSVFNTMLNSDMKENITNCIEISDFDVPVVKTMLRYIYCGKVEDLTPELSIQLYSIADKYNLQDLKNICVNFILQNLNVHNICDVLVLGDMHNEQALLKAAKNMFCEQAAAIQETEKWLDLSKTMPALAISMYRLLASQREAE